MGNPQGIKIRKKSEKIKENKKWICQELNLGSHPRQGYVITTRPQIQIIQKKLIQKDLYIYLNNCS